MKTCKKCGTARDASEFYRDERSKDGLRSTCTPCTRAQQAEYARRNQIERRGIPAQKTCPRCGITKPSSAFHFNRRRPDGLLAYCKECWAARAREEKYGLTPGQYEDLLSKSDGGCAVCDAKVGLCVDHDHETGAVRGILCGNCNRGIGYLQDDIERLRRAIEYLGQ